jgi:hypothetical protein
MEIATDGAPIELPEGFIPSGAPEKPRAILQRMPKVMQTHAVKAWMKHRGVIIRWSTLPPEEQAKVHFSGCHWNMEFVKPLGRWLIDCSNRLGGFNLNTPGTKAASIERFGKVQDDTIVDIFTAWYEYSERTGIAVSECFIWKADIEGAFPQFRWQPEAAKLMGMMIDDDLLYLHTPGNFGHTSSPGIWCVISNALLFMCLVVVTILGVLKKYVDDYNGFASKEHATRDEAVFHQSARAFLGQTAINESKTVHPTQHTDVLGWDTDLPAELCSPNTKGCNKLLEVFFCFDILAAQSYNLSEVLARVAERYPTGLVGMKALLPHSIT